METTKVVTLWLHAFVVTLRLLASSFISTGGEARTPDTWFWRPVLYQLSYTRRL